MAPWVSGFFWVSLWQLHVTLLTVPHLPATVGFLLWTNPTVLLPSFSVGRSFENQVHSVSPLFCNTVENAPFSSLSLLPSSSQMPWRVLVGAKQTGAPDRDTLTFPSLLGSGRTPSYSLEVVYGMRRHLVLILISSRREVGV